MSREEMANHQWTTEYYGEDGNGPPMRHCIHCGKIYSLPIEEDECYAIKNDHGKTKYHRKIFSYDGKELGIVDVYCVLNAFAVTNPAIAHAVKKLLCCGIRGKGDAEQDLRESIVAIERAIVIEKEKDAVNQ